MIFKVGQQFDVKDFEKKFPNLRLIAKFAQGSTEISLHHLGELNVYLEKGPYARWDAVCYEVCEVKDHQGEQDWIENLTKTMTRII